MKGTSMRQISKLSLLCGTALAAAVSPPTALSLSWGLDKYLPLIAAAADKA